jgi:hypothetical protein
MFETIMRRGLIFFIVTTIGPSIILWLVLALEAYFRFQSKLALHNINGCVDTGDGLACSWLELMNPTGLAGAVILILFFAIPVIWGPIASTMLFHYWHLPIRVQALWVLIMQALTVLVASVLYLNFVGKLIVVGAPWIGLGLGRLLIMFDCWWRKRRRIITQGNGSPTGTAA